ncbi:lipopolysaccharide biosynthesis protein [Nonomuraea sp. SYSU D8015]|uniref:lipopolysaccharide biosynthesis protein n=1 Tax=Nonomuraea sp. SYSU D8015 TaxID=2593644 RepID=UPI001660D755|nr:hypothetical protein [Nonomuraea sp. SYSU D8015]
MTDLLHHVRTWIRLPSRRHMTVFFSLGAAGQVEAGLAVLTTIALVRMVGAEEAGEVFFAQSLGNLWFLLWDPRLGDTAQRFVPLQSRTEGGPGSWLFFWLLRLDAGIGITTAVTGTGLVLLAHHVDWVDDKKALLLVLVLMGCGVTVSRGTAVAGFALSERLRLLGAVRMVAAGLSFVATMTALFMGGLIAYLVVAAVAGLATTIMLVAMAARSIVLAFGRPSTECSRPPQGLIRFACTTSAATSVALASDSGVLALAGLLGAPTLVTFLKIAGTPARMVRSCFSTVAAQLYPRLANAVVSNDSAGAQRDLLRATALLSVIGLGMVAMVLPVADVLLTLVYGPAYVTLAPTLVILLAAACVRETVVWSKVFPLAVGVPGVRFAVVVAEGILIAAMLVVATRLGAHAEECALIFAWGSLAVAIAYGTTWLSLMRPLFQRFASTAA